MDNFTEKERERFLIKTKQDGDCLTWTAPLDRDGYGTFFFRGANRRAHRVAWYSLHGEIPEGMVVNHVCRNRACVNPQHLQILTARENSMRDSTSVGYINSQKTHCPKGHPYDGVEVGNGKRSRVCTKCRREQQRIAARTRRRAAKSSLSV